MARASLTFDSTGFLRGAKRLEKVPARVKQIRQRAAATLQRRLGPETTRALSEEVFNVSPRRLRPHIHVTRHKLKDGEYLSVQASRLRLPLIAFSPQVSRTEGVTVTTWREGGAKRLPHAFRRKDSPGIWQRIPAKNVGKFRPGGRSRADQTAETASGLVARLPIVERKGPSLHRAFVFGGPRTTHTDVRPRLSQFAREVLSAEIARQLRASP